jgi:DNA-binding transcriptional LysR family regulator
MDGMATKPSGQPINLAAIDLNLLLVFDALMRDRNVTQAGQRIGLSQPAMSRALNRLRDIVGDELFVRRGNRMEPTPRAMALDKPLQRALVTIQDALRPDGFAPARVERSFRIATNDYAAALLLPALAAVLRADAPGIDIRVLAADEPRAVALLERDEIDLAIAPFEETRPGLARQELIAREGFLCVMRRDHPLSRGSLTLEGFTATPQILVSQTGDPVGFVDHILSEHGLRRRVVMTVPHFLVVPFVLARTDLVATLPGRLAHAFTRLLDLVALPPPFDQRRFPLAMVWNERVSADPGLDWLRARLAEAVS